jgi:hypothetical protein
MTRTDPLFGFRATLGAAAALIGIVALWVMTSELMTPRVPYFPASPKDAAALAAAQDLATTAAEVGMIRGDLWATAAVTRAAPLLFVATGGAAAPPAQNDVEKARVIAERAARLAPYDSRVWLLLAGLNVRLGADNAKVAELFKLSYYTGPSELSLIPLRLLLTVQSDTIADDELASLVQLDIQHIITERPDLKPAIALAYQNARPKGRDLIASTSAKLDPDFAATLAAPPRQQ